jgi:glycosyltransferase involved in cell wall biosynthesis
MRVLHVTSGNMYGGVETFLITLLREASSAPDMQPEFAVCFEGRFSSELEMLGHLPHRLAPARFGRPLTVLRARRALSDLLQRETYDVVVCHQPWTCVLLASAIRAAGFPLVLWVHMASDGRHWLERLCRFTRPDVALCSSRFVATSTACWLPDALIEHVYCPVSPPGLGARAAADRKQIRADLGTSVSDVVIAQVSRLEPWKGQHVLLSALGTLRDVPGWTCWVVGGPQRHSETRYLATLKRLAKTNGIEERVRFLGERRDVSAVLSAADMFCQPNTMPEPFGLSLVEAQQCGLPVVTTGIGGACEIVNGSCGILTQPGDVTSLANALRVLIADADLRARLGMAARKRPQELCDPSLQMRKIHALLTAVVISPRLEGIAAVNAK